MSTMIGVTCHEAQAERSAIDELLAHYAAEMGVVCHEAI